MKLKLKDLKHKSGNVFAEILIKNKEVVKTTSLNDEYIINGRKSNSDFRTNFDLKILDKYDSGFKYGNIVISYTIFTGTTLSAVVVVNYFQRVYLKLLFEHYLFQRMKGVKQILIGIFIGVMSGVIGGVILKLFTCD